METRKTIGKRIKIARIEIDKSQEWLAERFDVSQKTISAWESGRNPIESATLSELAMVLGKPVAYFFEPFDAFTQDRVVAEPKTPYATGGRDRAHPVSTKTGGGKRKAA